MLLGGVVLAATSVWDVSQVTEMSPSSQIQKQLLGEVSADTERTSRNPTLLPGDVRLSRDPRQRLGEISDVTERTTVDWSKPLLGEVAAVTQRTTVEGGIQNNCPEQRPTLPTRQMWREPKVLLREVSRIIKRTMVEAATTTPARSFRGHKANDCGGLQDNSFEITKKAPVAISKLFWKSLPRQRFRGHKKDDCKGIQISLENVLSKITRASLFYDGQTYFHWKQNISRE